MLPYPFVPHSVDGCRWVFLILGCFFTTAKHREKKPSHLLQWVSYHEHEAYGGGVGVDFLPGDHRIFAVFPMGNRIGIWATNPFSEAYQNTPPCFSLDSENRSTSIWRTEVGGGSC